MLDIHDMFKKERIFHFDERLKPWTKAKLTNE